MADTGASTAGGDDGRRPSGPGPGSERARETDRAARGLLGSRLRPLREIAKTFAQRFVRNLLDDLVARFLPRWHARRSAGGGDGGGVREARAPGPARLSGTGEERLDAFLDRAESGPGGRLRALEDLTAGVLSRIDGSRLHRGAGERNQRLLNALLDRQERLRAEQAPSPPPTTPATAPALSPVLVPVTDPAPAPGSSPVTDPAPAVSPVFSPGDPPAPSPASTLAAQWERGAKEPSLADLSVPPSPVVPARPDDLLSPLSPPAPLHSQTPLDPSGPRRRDSVGSTTSTASLDSQVSAPSPPTPFAVPAMPTAHANESMAQLARQDPAAPHGPQASARQAPPAAPVAGPAGPRRR
ncbi:hypothetical protein [Streptomyces sp. NPDC101249]|uniref:hypothetical protein n=1 Tax=Streptomyces sp. NPDC101249 TaxID=3366140 RepID=UPI0037F3D45F